MGWGEDLGFVNANGAESWFERCLSSSSREGAAASWRAGQHVQAKHVSSGSAELLSGERPLPGVLAEKGWSRSAHQGNSFSPSLMG